MISLSLHSESIIGKVEEEAKDDDNASIELAIFEARLAAPCVTSFLIVYVGLVFLMVWL